MRLLESKKEAKKGRSASGTIFSIILHSLIIFLAVFATARAGVRKAEKPKETKVNFVEMKKEPPPPKKEEPKPEPPKVKKTPTPPKVDMPRVAAPAPPQGFKVVAPPVNIPTNLPAIDMSKAITNENDFSGKGVAGGSATGVKGGTGYSIVRTLQGEGGYVVPAPEFLPGVQQLAGEPQGGAGRAFEPSNAPM